MVTCSVARSEGASGRRNRKTLRRPGYPCGEIIIWLLGQKERAVVIVSEVAEPLLSKAVKDQSRSQRQSFHWLLVQ